MLIPDYLTHYYFDVPFQTLTALDEASVTETLARLAKVHVLPFRLTRSDYLPRRRAIERQMRTAFEEMGGRVTLEHPHYMILGRSAHWETEGIRSLTIPLSDCDSEAISLTCTDSFYTYSPTTLRGISIPPRPHRGKLFRFHELEAIVSQFGLPPGYTDPKEEFDVYIEAQIWDDRFLRPFCDAGRGNREAGDDRT